MPRNRPGGFLPWLLAGALLAAAIVLPAHSVAAASQARVNTPAPPGSADQGRSAFGSANLFCSLCHGNAAQGGSGPDLAGRALTFDQFKRAVQRPWGMMPAYLRLSDQQLADLYAFVASAPAPAEPGEPSRTPLPPSAPRVQQIFMSLPCGHCHYEELQTPRRILGGVAADATLEYLARIVYDAAPPPTLASSHTFHAQAAISRNLIPETILGDILDFMKSDGLLVPVDAVIDVGAPVNGNTPFRLKVWNSGVAGKGLTAGGLTISLAIKTGVKVIGVPVGKGYQGISYSDVLKRNVITWTLGTLPPTAVENYQITLSGATDDEELFAGSVVAWARPGSTRPRNLTRKDERVPDVGDRLVAPAHGWTRRWFHDSNRAADQSQVIP
jgi:mono/diheme cytochrome c family protein